MYASVSSTLAALSRKSSDEAAQFFAAIASSSRNELVKVQWTVTYDSVGRDILSVAEVELADKVDALLQVWLRNAAAGIWIPEIQPWEVSVVEFAPTQKALGAKLGLLDSKWNQDDIGRKYHYALWGFLQHGNKVESFAFDKWATFPGDA